jgi:GH25 family lysozyme M1 (1,4-beta-N-acetylmuramidase)/acylphosphatase
MQSRVAGLRREIRRGMMRKQDFVVLSIFVIGCGGSIGGDKTSVSSASLTKCAVNSGKVYGVDVSGYQGSSINWSAVKAAGKDFAFAKATEGTGFIDSSFAHNWPGMKSAGVIRGAYHFFRPGDDGTAQADYFVDEIDKQGGLKAGDLPPVADVEVGDGESAATVISRLRTFLERVKSRTGVTPMIYTANFFWGDYMGNPNFSSYPLWVANYGPSCPYLPSAFSSWKFWQYSDDVKVNGISSGGVDGDEFDGSIDQLRAFAGGGATTGGGGGGGTSTSGVFQMSRRITQNGDGRLEMFARASDNGVWHDWQTSANGSWNGWADLKGTTEASPVVANDADGRLEVFVIVGGHLFHTFQLPGGGWYDGWLDEGDGNLVGEASAQLNSDGTLEVFARATSGALEHKWQTSANGTWSEWASLGGNLHADPIVGRNGDGRLEVFAAGADDKLWHIWQTAPHSSWSNWASFGGIDIKGTSRVGANADGRLEAFVTGSDDKLHHVVQLPGGGWSSFLDAGTFKIAGEPAVARNGDGRLEVFARGTDNQLWHLWQASANGDWTSGAAFAGTTLGSTPDVAPNADGRLEAFWRASNGSIATVFQQVGGGWSDVYSLAGNLAAF